MLVIVIVLLVPTLAAQEDHLMNSKDEEPEPPQPTPHRPHRQGGVHQEHPQGHLGRGGGSC